MIKKIKSILAPSIFAGIELLASSPLRYNLVVLKKIKNELFLVDQKIGLEGWEAFVEIKDQQIPIYLTLNIKGILHKQLAGINLPNYQALANILPNAEPQNFHLQKINQEKDCICSLIRRDQLQTILKTFQEQDLPVVQLSLGPFDVAQLFPFLHKKELVFSATHQLEFNESGNILAFAKYKAEPHLNHIGDEQIDNRLLVAYAAAFKGLMNYNGLIAVDWVNEIKREYFHQQLFRKVGWSFLIGLFSILLLNTFFYYYYKSKNEALAAPLLQSQSQLAQLDNLRSKVNRNEGFLQRTQIGQSSNSSFYADQLAETIPKGIQLQALHIFPVQGNLKDYRKEDLIRYQNNRITISGQCNSSLVYNNWLKYLQKVGWVKQVNHLEYKDLNASLAAFELEVFLNARTIPQGKNPVDF